MSGKLASVFAAAAAIALGQASPPAETHVAINGKNISIRYSAPSVRGRKIFGDGGLLTQDPTYPVWRAGANEATELHTDADLEIGAVKIPKGDYSLYCLVKDPEAWELIVNRQTGQIGLEYDQKRDVGRVKMTMAKPPSPIEKLKYTLSDAGGGKVKLQLEWERHIAS